MKRYVLVVVSLVLFSGLLFGRGSREEVSGEIIDISSLDAATVEVTLLQPDGTERIVEIPAGAAENLEMMIGQTIEFEGTRDRTGTTTRLRAQTATQSGTTTRFRTDRADTTAEATQEQSKEGTQTRDQSSNGQQGRNGSGNS